METKKTTSNPTAPCGVCGKENAGKTYSHWVMPFSFDTPDGRNCEGKVLIGVTGPDPMPLCEECAKRVLREAAESTAPTDSLKRVVINAV